MPNLTADEKIQQTKFWCEATSYEGLCIWEDYHQKKLVPWKQDYSGILETIGYLDERPICLSIRWNIIEGERVGFWEAVSQVTDHKQIDKWFDQLPNVIYKTNAMNFHNLYTSLRQEKVKHVKSQL